MSETIDVGLSYLAWYEDGEEGAIIGQSIHVLDGVYAHDWVKTCEPVDQSGRDYRAVEVAALEFAKQHPDAIIFDRAMGGWNSDNASKTVVMAFLRTCRAALRNAKRDVPWPAWAVEALAAGWKAPKGWKPT